MYVCILDAAGQVLVHRNAASTPAAFLETIAPYRDDVVVAAERMFAWYGLAVGLGYARRRSWKPPAKSLILTDTR
jgi:hypothetical protein